MKRKHPVFSDAMLRLLLDRTEAEAGIVPLTPADFYDLRMAIGSRLGETLGDSTLKRLWGYIGSVEAPRISTLNLLARFCGYDSMEAFVAENEASSKVQSDFRATDGSILHSAELTEGAEVVVSWLPDREVTFRHIDGNRFVVAANRNSKLTEGDTVEFTFLEQRQPLYADIVSSDGSRRSYVAGSRDGISFKCH